VLEFVFTGVLVVVSAAVGLMAVLVFLKLYQGQA
jgi:hypothetical protein